MPEQKPVEVVLKRRQGKGQVLMAIAVIAAGVLTWIPALIFCGLIWFGAVAFANWWER
ncbi:hypothetical protein RHDC3_00227 [Rhodocyclaceae bacterium]|nr:hypothetical protein RHDC3_00227 [Rhodocyclaceae bacterium]